MKLSVASVDWKILSLYRDKPDRRVKMPSYIFLCQ